LKNDRQYNGQKRKRPTVLHKTIDRKLKIDKHVTHTKTGVNSVASVVFNNTVINLEREQDCNYNKQNIFFIFCDTDILKQLT
jgi:hypothetical protein